MLRHLGRAPVHQERPLDTLVRQVKVLLGDLPGRVAPDPPLGAWVTGERWREWMTTG